MHSSFRVGDTIMLASDGRCQGQTHLPDAGSNG
jgi:hypothetical protein